MIDPQKIFVAVPCMDWRIDCVCAMGLLQVQAVGGYAEPYFHVGCSNIALCRNEIAHHFMTNKPQYDWLMWIDSDIQFSVRDWELFWEGDELLATAEYSRKEPELRPLRFGMGFVRVHRRIYEMLSVSNREDGAPLLNQFYHKGQVYTDYFYNGATSDARWLGEDDGFWTIARLAGLIPKIETRTQLIHWGRAPFPYQPSTNDKEYETNI